MSRLQLRYVNRNCDGIVRDSVFDLFLFEQVIKRKTLHKEGVE